MLPDDWDQFEILMQNAIQRVPALETAEVKQFMNGPESFTADNNAIGAVHFDDISGRLHARRKRQLGAVLIPALHHQYIGKIQAAGQDTDYNLTSRGGGRCNVHDLQVVQRAQLAAPNG